MEGLGNKLVEGLPRSLDIHNAILKHVEYTNDAIKWIEIKCDEGILYVAAEEFGDVALFMSEYEIEKEKVMHIVFYEGTVKEEVSWIEEKQM